MFLFHYYRLLCHVSLQFINLLLSLKVNVFTCVVALFVFMFVMFFITLNLWFGFFYD